VVPLHSGLKVLTQFFGPQRIWEDVTMEVRPVRSAAPEDRQVPVKSVFLIVPDRPVCDQSAAR